jgi:uncharacterized membrane protein YfcA
VAAPALAVAVGLASGVLSGAFGIGGGLVTTPAIRLLLGYPALIAVGTPLPVILPTALAGAFGYYRRGLVDARAALCMGAAGAVPAVLAAWATRYTGGSPVMLLTAALVAWVAADMFLHPSTREAAEPGVPGRSETPVSVWRLATVGLVAGLYSGFLGLGGGFVVVPALSRWLGWPLKRAIGTSLLTVAVLAVPGSVTHYALGHIDLRLALLLACGAVPGAILGAKLTSVASERAVSIGFALLLAVTAVALALTEIAGFVG